MGSPRARKSVVQSEVVVVAEKALATESVSIVTVVAVAEASGQVVVVP